MENGMKWNYGEVGICGSCNGSGSSSGVCRLEVKKRKERCSFSVYMAPVCSQLLKSV
jgi:hypothetical protein